MVKIRGVRNGAAAIWLLFGAVVSGQTPNAHAALTHVRVTHVKDVRELSPGDADKHQPLQVRGVVTAFSGWKNSFFLEESGDGISVDRTDNAEVHVGDEVEITGTSGAGLFAPVILASYVQVLGKAKLPAASPAVYADLAGGKEDSQLVETHGVVHSAKVAESWGRSVLFLQIDIGGGMLSARVYAFPKRDFSDLVDAEIRVRGVCGTNFNQRRQFVGPRLFIPDFKDIDLIKTSEANPFEIRESSIQSLLQFGSTQPLSHRVKISGVLTYQKPGHLLYLQSGDEGVAVQSSDPTRFEAGSRLEAVGFVGSGEYAPELQDAIVRRTAAETPPAPVKVTAAQIIQAKDGFLTAPYDGLLVQLDGELVDKVDHAGEQVWLLRNKADIFRAKIPTNAGDGGYANIRSGTRLRITGICVVETDGAREPVSFYLLPRSTQDIFIAGAPLWGAANIFAVIAFLILACFGMLAWILQLGNTLPPYRAESALRSSSIQLVCRRISRYAGLMVCGGATMVLAVGWGYGVAGFRRIADGYPDMAPNTALALLLLGIAVFVEHAGAATGIPRRLVQVCSALAALLTACTLLEELFGIDLGIDAILILGRATGGSRPLRMSVPTAASVVLVGCALFFWHHRRGILFRQCLLLLAGGVGLLNLIGFLYGVKDFYGLTPGAGTAIHTSIALIVLGVAVLLSRSESGVMATLTSSEPGGVLSRRLLPAAILIPTVLGWLRWQGQLKGWYDTSFGLALYAAANVLTFTVLIWINGDLLNRLGLQRSRVEDSLRAAEECLTTALAFSEVATWTWNLNEESVQWSGPVADIFGYTPAELSSYAAFAAIIIPDDREIIDQKIANSVKTGVSYSGEFRIKKPAGDIRWIAGRGGVSFDESGRVRQMAGANYDITDRKNAEALVEQSEMRFRELANAMPQIVWTAAADGQFDYFNERWYQFTGAECRMKAEQSWISALHPDEVQRCREIWHAAVRAGSPYEMECRLLDGPAQLYRWHLVRALPVHDREGQILRWLGTCTDVNEKKTAEARLEAEVLSRTEELRHSLLEKDTLLREVHHRVKNNLQVISSLLRMQAETLNDPAAAAALKESQQRVYSMALIHERLYGGRQMNEIDFGEYTRTLINELLYSYGGLSRRVSGRLKTSQVLLNIDQAIPCGLILNELVSNALKYAYPDGQSGEVVVDIRQTPSDHLVLTVSDAGVGLPEGFDLKKSKSLGLPIVELLARQLGGTLSMQRQAGATFTVEFPREPTAAKNVPAA